MFTLHAFSLIKSFQANFEALQILSIITSSIMVVSLKSRGKKLTSSSPSRQRCLLLSTATLCLLLLSSFFIAINLDVQQETLRSDIKRQQPAAATKQQKETEQTNHTCILKSKRPQRQHYRATIGWGVAIAS